MAAVRQDLLRRIKRLYESSPASKALVAKIHQLASRVSSRLGEVKIMNFCGTHEWTITHYGLRTLMPREVKLVAGPGCPVCITPGGYVDQLIKLSLEGVHVLTYGDAFRLPSTAKSKVRSLADAKALGGKVTVVYSFVDAVRKARSRPGETFVFFAIGFETTMPSTAELLAKGAVPKNLLLLTAYRLTPPIMRYLLEHVEGVELHGVIAPGHVSSVIGASAWRFLPERYGVPTVVAGFEPLDVLVAIIIILEQLEKRVAKLINEYKRVVGDEGNAYAKRVMQEVYETRDAYWRGIGVVPESGGYLRDRFREYDALVQLGLREPTPFDDMLPGCRCHEVVLGKAVPTDCPLFMTKCTPETPYGPCMVSLEGTCRIWAENLPLPLEEL